MGGSITKIYSIEEIEDNSELYKFRDNLYRTVQFKNMKYDLLKAAHHFESHNKVETFIDIKTKSKVLVDCDTVVIKIAGLYDEGHWEFTPGYEHIPRGDISKFKESYRTLLEIVERFTVKDILNHTNFREYFDWI